jgi:predicted component of type VI protein secretion system
MRGNPKRSRNGGPITDEIARPEDTRPRLPDDLIATSAFDAEDQRRIQAAFGLRMELRPAFLYVERGPGAGQLIEVKEGSLVVGRSSVSQLILKHPSISRRHTQVRREGESFYVRDLGSQNGTYVNKDRALEEVELKAGDTIAIGNALLRLRVQSNSSTKHKKISAASAGDQRMATSVISRNTNPQMATPRSSTALKVAIFVGAVGLSLAAVLAYAMLTTTPVVTPVAEPIQVTPPPRVEKVERSEQAQLIDEAIRRTMAEAAAAAPAPTPTEVATPSEDETVESEPVTVKASTVAPSLSPTPPPRAKPIKKSGSRKVSKAVDTRTSAKATRPASAVLAAYESGDAKGALDAAKKAVDKVLVDRLTRFIAAHDGAKEAVRTNNAAKAISQLLKALELDEKIGGGWGSYQGEIRKELAGLYLRIGLQFIANGDAEKAKAALKGALKQEPSNRRAQEELAKLGAAPAAVGDGDSDGEDKPALGKGKPAQAPKPEKSNIDDAFGE